MTAAEWHSFQMIGWLQNGGVYLFQAFQEDNQGIREIVTENEILGKPSIADTVRENWTIISVVNYSITETIRPEKSAAHMVKPAQHGGTDILHSVHHHSVNFLQCL